MTGISLWSLLYVPRFVFTWIFLAFINVYVLLGFVYPILLAQYTAFPIYPDVFVKEYSLKATLASFWITASIIFLNILVRYFNKVRKPIRIISGVTLDQGSVATWTILVVLSYVSSLYVGALSVGKDPRLVLPFSLNPILRTISLSTLPIVLALFFKNKVALGFVLIFMIGSLNLVSSGSKFSAISPIIIYTMARICISALSDGHGLPWKSVKMAVASALVIIAFYVVINPYYFRSSGGAQAYQSSFALVSASFESAWAHVSGPGEQIVLGLRNISSRLVGIISIEWSIQMVSEAGSIANVWQYLNEVYHGVVLGRGHAYAPGHFGFFIAYTGSLIGGVLAGVSLLFGIVILCALFEGTVSQPLRLRRQIVLVSGLVPLMGLVIDGMYSSMAIYKTLILSVSLAYIFAFSAVRPSRVRSS